MIPIEFEALRDAFEREIDNVQTMLDEVKLELQFFNTVYDVNSNQEIAEAYNRCVEQYNDLQETQDRMKAKLEMLK